MIRWHRWLGFALVIVLVVDGCDGVTTVTEEPAEFRTVLSVSSDVLDATGDTLVGDRVRFSAAVTRNDRPYAAANPRFESSDSNVVRILDAGTGQAVLAGVGEAMVSVSFDAAQPPDSLLRASLVVPVDSFAVALELVADAPGASGDTLVGDTVRFETRVTRIDGRAVEARPLYRSSDPSTIRILDASEGTALLAGAGEAEVTATLQQPVVPNGPLASTLAVRVKGFSVELNFESVSSGRVEAGDTLVSDSVRFDAVVNFPDRSVPVADPVFSTSDGDVIQVLDPAEGLAVFADTGTATISVSFTEPEVPRPDGSLTVRVTTYRVRVTGPVAPVMGDTVDYDVAVTATRDGATLPVTGARFSSSNGSVAEVVEAGAGRTFVRDIGGAVIRVRMDEPSLPHRSLTGDTSITVSEERFYGPVSSTAGDFGDTVRVFASEVHEFTPNTRVVFPNGTIGFVESSTPGELVFTVGAGTDVGQLLLRNLVDTDGADRGDVLTRWTFSGGGTVADAFEPNDNLPLEEHVEITSFPFEALLSVDPAKSAPADTNFFYFSVSAASTVDVTARWQQDADLDFKICEVLGLPPSSYKNGPGGVPNCPYEPSDNGSDRSREEVRDLLLARATYVVAFYCVDCPGVPLTYRMDIDLLLEDEGEDDDLLGAGTSYPPDATRTDGKLE